MTFRTFSQSFKTKWEAVSLIIITATTLGLYINFFLPHLYRSTSEFLVIQKQNPSIDAYTAIKGSEQLAYTLKQVVLSHGFLQEVLKSNFDLKINYFRENPEKNLKKWQKTVRVDTLPNTGILRVTVWHPQQKKATEINETIGYLLLEKREGFLGENPEITITRLGSPITSTNFKKPNAPVNVFLGFLIGALVSLGLVILFPEKTFSFSRAEQRKPKIVKKGSVRRKDYKKEELTPSNLPVA